MYALSVINIETCVALPLLAPVTVYGTVIVSPLLVTSPFPAIVISLSKSVSLYSAPVVPTVPKMTDVKSTDDSLILKAGLTPVLALFLTLVKRMLPYKLTT